MKVITGDLIELVRSGEFDVIVHGCNCFNTMDAGIAQKIKKAFPEAYQVDQQTRKGDKDKLGTITWAKHTLENQDKDVVIVNAYTQYDYKGSGNLDYTALDQCFSKIKHHFAGKKIGYPAIGAGLAGGEWERIARIIDQRLQGEDHVLVKFNG